ncbi:MAG: DUF362 domain-containing protein [Acidobacteriales bacterium]|nr:MAG: DUF362 domain-containing protein [Terriglobales bacterium]
MAEATCHVVTRALRRNPREIIAAALPGGAFRHILIKPNWVMHQSSAHFPIEALVTSTRLIEETIEACLERYPSVQEITVGDAGLQTCEFELMSRQSGLAELAAKYRNGQRGVPIQFLDLRRDRFRTRAGFQVRGDCSDGDPRGYRQVVLDRGSYLEEISREANSFRVSDYDPEQTADSHAPGVHRYLIAASVLDADLCINMPKAKTHQKAGITGALKNLVGIVGDKACLVHYRVGTPPDGGDEFAPHTPALVRLQVRWRERLQQKSRWGFCAGRAAWQVLRRLRGIQTQGTPANLRKTYFRAGGAWPGNDTIWRMIYDLNQIILYAPKQGGSLAATPQRSYLAVLDGLVAGEGDGPLQPLPVAAETLMVANDPFLADCVLARWMGFDYRRIPQLAHRTRFAAAGFGGFDPQTVLVQWDDKLIRGLGNLPAAWSFRPAPGWEEIQEG